MLGKRVDVQRTQNELFEAPKETKEYRKFDAVNKSEE